MVVQEVVKTRTTIIYCVKLGYKQAEMLNLLQRGGDALEMKKVQCFRGTHGLRKDKRAFNMALGVNAER